MVHAAKKLDLVDEFDVATDLIEKELVEDEGNKLMCEWMVEAGTYTVDDEGYVHPARKAA